MIYKFRKGSEGCGRGVLACFGLPLRIAPYVNTYGSEIRRVNAIRSAPPIRNLLMPRYNPPERDIGMVTIECIRGGSEFGYDQIRSRWKERMRIHSIHHAYAAGSLVGGGVRFQMPCGGGEHSTCQLAASTKGTRNGRKQGSRDTASTATACQRAANGADNAGHKGAQASAPGYRSGIARVWRDMACGSASKPY